MLIGFDASRAFAQEATGTENYSLNLLQALAKIDRKNRYRVYIRSVGRWDGRMVGQRRLSNYPKNFEFIKVQPSRLWTQFGLALETWRNPPEVLFVPAHTLPILRNPRVKTVVTIHDLGVEYLPGYHQFPQRYYLDLASKYAASRAEAIIAVSKATKRDLVNRYKVSAKRVFVVSEGVETRFFKPQSESKVKSVKSKYEIEGSYILAVGTVQPRKNLQMLIETFAKVSRMVGVWDSRSKVIPTSPQTQKPTDLKLVIAGKLGWDYEQIVNLPKKLGIGDKVKFLGYVPRVDLPALYSGSMFFMAPSLFEGFDLPILEALASGCQVLASDIGPHREIFAKISRIFKFQISNFKFTASKEAAMPITLVKLKDINRWTQFLYQYISQYDKRSTLGSEKSRSEAMKEALASEFSWERVARETLRVLGLALS